MKRYVVLLILTSLIIATMIVLVSIFAPNYIDYASYASLIIFFANIMLIIFGPNDNNKNEYSISCPDDSYMDIEYYENGSPKNAKCNKK